MLCAGSGKILTPSSLEKHVLGNTIAGRIGRSMRVTVPSTVLEENSRHMTFGQRN